MALNKFTVSRSKWLRGQLAWVPKQVLGPGEYYRAGQEKGGHINTSKLLRHCDNRQCCLGFYCEQAGFSREALTEAADPSELYPAAEKEQLPDWFFCQYEDQDGEMRIDRSTVSPFLLTIMKYNDRPDIPDTQREKWLQEEFAKHGIEVTFVD